MPSQEVKKIMEDKNIWAKHAEEFRLQRSKYVVPEDKNALVALKKFWPELYNRIYFDLIPDPIIGNIDAPVCLILINPGYSPIDVYNYSSISDKKAVMDAGLTPGPKMTPYNVTFRYEGKEETDMLERRRQVLIDSYYMKPGASFYAFDPSFNTVEVRTLEGRYHPKKLGSYLWYKALLNKVPENRRTQVMDLEFFPYHTAHFNVNRLITLEKEHPECRMAHSDLRDALIRQFSEEGRLFIARTEDIYKYLLNTIKIRPNQVCKFRSSGNMVISRGNVIAPNESLKKLYNILDI